MDDAVRFVSMFMDLLFLFKPSRLQVQSNLLQNHVLRLLAKSRLGVGPPVGQRKLQSIVRVL